MFIRSAIIGILFTVVLVALLSVSRFLVPESQPQLLITEVEVMEIEDEPPPPDFTEPEEEPEDIPPPPAPNLDVPLELTDLETPQVASSLNNVSLTAPIENFHTDIAPAPLPIVKKKAAPVKVAPKVIKQTVRKPSKPKAIPQKSHYSFSELDSKPRVRRRGKFVWPRGVKKMPYTFRVSIEIDTKGRVRVLEVLSSGDPKMIKQAIKVASGTRFTPPMKGGTPVKARYIYKFQLQ